MLPFGLTNEKYRQTQQNQLHPNHSNTHPNYRRERWLKNNSNSNIKLSTSKHRVQTDYRFKPKPHQTEFNNCENLLNDVKVILGLTAKTSNVNTTDLLKLSCNIYDNSVDSLVDTGASANYISQDLINKILVQRHLYIKRSHTLLKT